MSRSEYNKYGLFLFLHVWIWSDVSLNQSQTIIRVNLHGEWLTCTKKRQHQQHSTVISATPQQQPFTCMLYAIEWCIYECKKWDQKAHSSLKTVEIATENEHWTHYIYLHNLHYASFLFDLIRFLVFGSLYYVYILLCSLLRIYSIHPYAVQVRELVWVCIVFVCLYGQIHARVKNWKINKNANHCRSIR